MGYFQDIPETVPTRLEQLNKAPSYRQICKAIIKNDYTLKSLGLGSQKPKSYHLLKRIEIKARNLHIQLELF